jgi:hypothetical protein
MAADRAYAARKIDNRPVSGPGSAVNHVTFDSTLEGGMNA